MKSQLDIVNDLAIALNNDMPEKKINQIKILRNATGFGLKESKDIVEAWGSETLRRQLIETALNAQGASLGDILSNAMAKKKNDAHIVFSCTNSGAKCHYHAETLAEAQRVREFIFNDIGCVQRYPAIAKVID